MSENVSATPSPQPPVAVVAGKGMNIGIAVAAVLSVGGFVLWGVQLSGGLVQTNMRNFDSWGLYITMFMFLVGLSAGALLVASAPRALGMRGFGGVAKVAAWASICCTVLAIGFVVVDLGRPERLWELFATSNLGSPLMWDIVVLGVYLILSAVYLWAAWRAEAGKVSQAAFRAISVAALACAILVLSVDAWIFGLQQAHEFWHTALLAPWFVSSALVCGAALVLVVVIALRRVGYLELDQHHVAKLAKMLGVFIVVDLYFFGCDLLTFGFPGGTGADVVSMLTTGVLARFFWVEVVGCALAALVCFVPRLRINPFIVVASLLAIVGIFCKRVQLLVGGFQLPNIDYAGPLTSSSVTNAAGGMASAYQNMVYWPGPLEFGLTLGVVGLGVLMLLVGLKYLPLKPAEQAR